jgi:hypothetical protein
MLSAGKGMMVLERNTFAPRAGRHDLPGRNASEDEA